MCCSAPALAGFTTDTRGWRRRRVDTSVRAAPGRRQEYDVRAEHRQLHRLHQGVARGAATGRHAQHAPVHERHEELPGQARRTRVREGS